LLPVYPLNTAISCDKRHDETRIANRSDLDKMPENQAIPELFSRLPGASDKDEVTSSNLVGPIEVKSAECLIYREVIWPFLVGVVLAECPATGRRAFEAIRVHRAALWAE
jgi:hypothetical protein